ncbi:hypothetical protein D3C87_36280 [compost metagenome]
MKKHTFLFVAIIGFLVTSCSSGPKENETAPGSKTADSLDVEKWYPETNFDTLSGEYIGNFGDGFIKIVLTYVNDKKAIGYNINKGLQRNITGQVVQQDDRFELTLNEPGDNEYDGIFVLNISKKDGSVDGNWTANDPKIPSKKFKLKKKTSKKSTDSKSIYEGGELTEDNFTEVFSYAGFDSGNLEFKENGIALFTYYPEQGEEVERQNQQQEIIKGSWNFTDKKTLVIEWAKNTRFNLRKMTFKLIKGEYDQYYFEGPNEDLNIYPYLF